MKSIGNFIISMFWLTVIVICLSGMCRAQQTKEKGVLKMRGIKVSKGAAPGYIPDRVCGQCHTKLYRSYQKVGMSQSFYRPRSDRFIEDFKNNLFYHSASKRYYRIDRKGDTLTFKRYQLDANKKAINVFTRRIDWILGSGNHSRVYLYRTPSGEMFQLPLAWYSQEGGSWGMSPGFDNAAHHGIARRVRRECMFCHNAYPNVPLNSDIFEAPQVYPKELPQGTGCQRCHGPGAKHARIVMEGDFDSERIRAAIVNPKRLDPKRRNDVCYQCHMQPSVSLFGIRRFGVPDYWFRPGQKMGDYLPHMEIKEEGKEKGERFEINHHPYRMEQSKCFTASKGKLFCLTCHNPHKKVVRQKRAAHYRNACLTCHKPKQCPEEAKTVTKGSMGNCVGCHMPQRRTQDVVKVIMTDHLIQRKAESKKERLAPLKEKSPIITDAQFLYPDASPSGDVGRLYRAVSVLRAGGGARAANSLQNLLYRTKPKEITPYLDMTRALFRQRKHVEAEFLLAELLQKYPKNVQVMEWLGLTRIVLNKQAAAENILKQALKQSKNRPQIQYNLGLLYMKANRFKEAAERFTQAVKIQPIHYMAWFHLGNVQLKLGQGQKAENSYKRALEIEPSFTRGYLSLGRLLLKNGNRTGALRYLKHGANVAANPDTIKKALSKL